MHTTPNTPKLIASTLTLVLLLGSGCTVDSNARLTLGGERASTLEADEANNVTLSTLSDPVPGSLTGPSSPVTSDDRSAWTPTRVVVPAYEVRHGAFIGTRTLIASDSPRYKGQVPTPSSALQLTREESGWPQVLEVPLVVYSFGKDIAAGVSRVVHYGPGGWHASPSWGGERTFGDKPSADVDASLSAQTEASE